jgi:prepilin-type N-terminal cleavage/methylation domain-containing protein
MKNGAGFTLVELLVVTGIIVVISTIVLVDNNRFGGAVLLENLAYNVALSVRQAQVYGISVERFGANTFNAGYGVHFDLSSPNTYVLFADVASKGTFNPTSDGSEIVQTTTISTGYSIYDLCVTAVSDELCNSSSPGAATKIDVLFRRPEPDAFISVNGTPTFNAGTVIPGALNQRARVLLKAPRGDKMSVVIYINGQISVQKVQ